MKYGIIAGNGRFPVLALETARRQGDEAIAFAIKEEARPEVERAATRCYWISLGDLSKLIDTCKREGIRQIMMAGQVKHAKIFSAIRPDWRLLKLLAALPRKNTDSLIGGGAESTARRRHRAGGFHAAAEAAARGGRSYLQNANPMRTSARYRIRPQGSLTRSRVSISARAWRSRTARAWRSKPWKAPTPCCAAPPAWSKGSD